ncbi:hypothetical protein A0O28_0096310 [Trichoderma guizhouense]|uniref:Uncharacterized protein n=1 Tax=Trichoderma guizhouense TaxID=1491466 RepID=A0A1T3CFG0_9HYPO|nr:hypothetical protein A0O28_0096310 [Trichoderma guizhouense]
MWSMWSKGFMSLQGISQGDSRKATDTVLHRGEWRAASIQGLVLLGLVTLPKVGGDGWGGESNSLIDLFFLFPLFPLLQRSISTGTTLKKAAWPPNFASADPVLSCPVCRMSDELCQQITYSTSKRQYQNTDVWPTPLAAPCESLLDIASNPSLVERARVAYHTYASAITPNPFVCACAILTGLLFEHWRDCASALALTNQSA